MKVTTCFLHWNPLSRNMTSTEALRILAVPKFGDPAHIAAVHYLEDVALAREAAAKCRHKKCRYCLGKVRVGRGDDRRICDVCNGAGTDDAICHCFVGLGVEAVLEARGK